MKGGDTPTLAYGALRGVVNAKTLAEMPDSLQQQDTHVRLSSGTRRDSLEEWNGVVRRFVTSPCSRSYGRVACTRSRRGSELTAVEGGCSRSLDAYAVLWSQVVL